MSMREPGAGDAQPAGAAVGYTKGSLAGLAGLAGRVLDVAGSPAARRIWLFLIIPLALTALAWQAVQFTDTTDADASWNAALSVAHVANQHLIFTYGPLGYLATPQSMWFSGAALENVMHLLLIRFGTAAAVFLALRRSFGTLAGFLIAIPVCTIASQGPQVNELTAFLIAAVAVIDRPPSLRTTRLVVAAGALIAAIEMLMKVSTGVQASALLVIFCLSLPGSRRSLLGIAAATWVVVLLVLWLAIGESLGWLPTYLHGAVSTISGYAGALDYEQPGLGWEYAAGWVVFFLGLGAAWQMTDPGDGRRRWGIAGLWLVFAFFNYKEGFVRHDSGHGPLFFDALCAGVVAFRFRPGRRQAGLAVVASAFAMALAGLGASFSALITPLANANTAIRQVENALKPSFRAEQIALGRAAAMAAYPLSSQMLALLNGEPVAIPGHDQIIAWAYKLDYRALPVLQDYQTYTSYLDGKDAAALSGSGAPARLLLDNTAPILGEYPGTDDPQTTRTIFCHYQELRVESTFDLLTRARNRCGASTLLSTVHAAWGQTVTVPAPPNASSVVYLRISGVAPGGLESLRAMLYRPYDRSLVVFGRAYKLIAATAGDGILVAAPAALDFTPPFNAAVNSPTIAITRQNQPTGGTPLTLRFYTEPVTTSGRAAGFTDGAS